MQAIFFLPFIFTPTVAPSVPAVLPLSSHDSYAQTRKVNPREPVLGLAVNNEGLTRVATATAFETSTRTPLLGWDPKCPVALHPTQALLAGVSSSKTIGIANIAANTFIPCATVEGARPTAISFTANGTHILATWPGHLAIWNLEGKLVRVVKDHFGWTSMPAAALSPNASIMVLGSRAVLQQQGNFTVGSTFKTMGLTDGKVRWEYQRGTLPHTAIACSACGKYYATAGATLREPAMVELLDASSGAILFQTVLPGRTVSHVAFAPNARTLAVTIDAHQILLIEVASGQIRKVFSGHQGEADPATAKDIGGFGSDWVTDYTPPTASWLAAPAFSASGRFLATTVPEGSVYVWDTFAPRLKRKNTLTVRDAEALMEDLASEDAHAAYEAINRLAEVPVLAIEVVKAKAQASTALTANQVAELLWDLDDPSYAKREAATQELMKHADEVAPAVRRMLAVNMSPEVTKRATLVLAAATQTKRKVLVATRWVEVLERLNTPAAKATLTDWANGTAGATVAQVAR